MVETFLGRQTYSQGLKLQDDALELLRSTTKSAVVLGLEHDPVITLGVRGSIENDLRLSVATLAAKGLEVHRTERGGQATVHTPGQLVIYPCLDLKAYSLGARLFVELMAKTTQDFFRRVGVETTVNPIEPGLFVGEKKIAAFGFKISRGLTSHGIAINVDNDLSQFDLIRTCGVIGQPVTRLKDLGVDTSLEDLFSTWCHCLKLPAIVKQPTFGDLSL